MQRANSQGAKIQLMLVELALSGKYVDKGTIVSTVVEALGVTRPAVRREKAALLKTLELLR